jgi:predicted lysophospholipase L1 biosynthesis ABC-type transport system permease subunit
MIAPSVGDLFTNGLGEGGWVYGPALHAAVQQSVAASQGGSAEPPTVFNVFAVRFVPGTSVPGAVRTLRHQFGPVVLRQIPAQDVVNLENVDRLPLVISALVVLLGAATVGNSLIGTVRRRRRDIAVLKTIGFLRRQVAGAVAWQATTFSLVALVVGLPVGVAVGRWAWSLVASGIGSASPPIVPTLSVALVVPASLLLANALSAAPGWVAARIAPAVTMRAE